MIWYLQIASILFALAMAWHNAPSVSQFEHSGINNLWMARFHRYGWWTKAVFAGLAAIPGQDWIERGVFGLVSGLWIYLLFDPVLNRSRIPARRWHYLGLNDADGRFWNGTFGQHAGKIKAVVLTIVIVTINILYKCL